MEEKMHLDTVLNNATECTVLLKSDGRFPIERPGKIAAFGAGLRHTVMGGTGSGEVNTRYAYTIEQGLEKEGFEITSKQWLDAYDAVRAAAKKAFYKTIKKEARSKHENPFIYTMGKAMKEPYHELPIVGAGDTAIYVVSRDSGEGSDREILEGDVKLTKSEVRDILLLNQNYERFMLVLNVGGVVDLSPVTAVENILLLSQLGIDCGKVLADILTGTMIRTLRDEALAFLGIGGFDPNAKGLSIIGNAATHVAGAAGETTAQLADRGVRPLVMADGPAGLRVALHYYEDEKGAHASDGAGMMPESMLEMMGPVVGFLAKKIAGGRKNPKGAQIKEHAATRIPIGTAIAQSFNLALAESLGDIVGSEMEAFGIDLWLAPALNIHRNILCGRNFEYYSEDPLLSGRMAAAITNGVQRHKGCGTTIKHYAANNAETNRYCNNSHVSERAMREIYLRGFGICVRESQPEAVMTSYNLLNGTHTSEHRGLIWDILRCEYAFRGIVMTDWVLSMMDSKRSIYRNALSNEVAAAGGDLFMPGGKKDYENLLRALQNGTLKREQLEINASRVLRLVKRFSENIEEQTS